MIEHRESAEERVANKLAAEKKLADASKPKPAAKQASTKKAKQDTLPENPEE